MKRLLFLSIAYAPLGATSLIPPISLPSLPFSTVPLEKEKDKEKPTPQPLSLTPQIRLLAKEYLSLAHTCVEEEKYEKAIGYFQEVIKRTPENKEALSKLGELFEQLHRYNHAIEYYKKIIELDPTNSAAHTNLGICYFHVQKFTDAKTHLTQTIGLNPYQANAHLYLGMIAQKEKQFTQAISHYQKALAQEPTSFDVHYHIGTTFTHVSQWSDAIAHYTKALEIDADHTGAMIALANTYNLSGNPDSAISLYEKILAKDSSNTTARYNYGYTLKQKGKLSEAITVYHQVLIEQPDYALAHFSLGLTYLTLGNFEEGLPEYEWRTRLYHEPLPEIKAPKWEGQTIENKSILLIAEQGLGDTLQCIRYAQQLKTNGARIILMAQEPLVALLSLCPYLDSVISTKEQVPTTDYWLPVMSLPHQFKTTIKTIPHQVPYIKSHPHLTAYWRSYFSDNSNFKIGICWQGNDFYHTQPLKYAILHKSVPLKTLMAINTVSGITIYSLQQQLGTEQISELSNPKDLHTFDTTFDVAHGRFMDSAAVISNLDLIISADTAVAHLAAALGKPVWLLVSTPCDWRWLLDRSDSPWYPTMRIFRQKTPGDWSSVITEVIKELDTLLKNR